MQIIFFHIKKLGKKRDVLLSKISTTHHNSRVENRGCTFLSLLFFGFECSSCSSSSSPSRLQKCTIFLPVSQKLFFFSPPPTENNVPAPYWCNWPWRGRKGRRRRRTKKKSMSTRLSEKKPLDNNYCDRRKNTQFLHQYISQINFEINWYTFYL